jgi:hypothetical protein
MKYARNFLFMVAYVSFVYAGFFTNSTLYTSGSMGTPFLNGNSKIDDDYKYTLGVRKIALFPYQKKANFYKGAESQLSDNALFGAVEGLEYLLSASSVRTQGHEYIDQEYWLKWSNKSFVAKFKYLDKESRDLEFGSVDFRYKLAMGPAIVSLGGNIKGHPTYGHPAYDDYKNPWWELAYEYGYTDYLVPTNDLNDNGEIDSYYVWIETDPYTEDGYWIYYYEGAHYYWEDPNGNAVANSDAEFNEYHMPGIIVMYNENNKVKEWQAEASLAIGVDFYLGNDNYYSHVWVNAFPESVGLTEKSYTGDDIQYDIGALVGANLSEHIGVFIEGNKLSYFGREEYNIGMGVNYRF